MSAWVLPCKVSRPPTASKCGENGGRGAENGMFQFVHQTILHIGNTHEYTVRDQTCCMSRANDVIVVVYGVSGVPNGALLVVLQQWLLVASVCRTFLVG